MNKNLIIIKKINKINEILTKIEEGIKFRHLKAHDILVITVIGKNTFSIIEISRNISQINKNIFYSIEKLEKLKLLTRMRNEFDGRSVDVQLTLPGLEVYERAMKIIDSIKME